jgi:hypothetical protein
MGSIREIEGGERSEALQRALVGVKSLEREEVFVLHGDPRGLSS